MDLPMTLADKVRERLAYDPRRALVSTAAIDEALVKCVEAARGVTWINKCRCNVAYTGRGRHEPNSICGELDTLVEALAALERAVEGK